MAYRAWTLIVLTCVVATVGCSGEFASVEGRVLLDGQPLAAVDDVSVTVLFHPEAGGAIASGRVDDSGYYYAGTGGIEGLRRGKYGVTVQGMRVKKPAGNGYPMPTRITPKQYADVSTSGLTVEVAGRGVDYDIELVSKR